MAGLTEEQQTILDFCVNNKDSDQLVLINAVAGSGKTHMLRSIAENVPNTNSLYLAYNKSVAEESKGKFPKSVACSTTHALAYRAVVPELKAKVEPFTSKNIPFKMDPQNASQLVDALREFCLSIYVDWELFCSDNELPKEFSPYGTQILDSMVSGDIPLTHDTYLKIFHIWLSTGHVTYPSFDIVMLDEAGDLNEVTLEIFKLLPAKLKIAVGDQHQNIYSFNHTINCFKVLNGNLFNMTKSFRVAPNIAKQVEYFSQKFIDPNMQFKGTDQPRQIETTAYITRTNAALIDKMIELDSNKVKYKLVRSVEELFKLPLILCFAKPNTEVKDKAFKYLEKAINDYYDETIEFKKKYSLFTYLATKFPDDFALQQAMNLVIKHTKLPLLTAYNNAKAHKHTVGKITLLTAHSSKGLEFDHVELAPDLDSAVVKAIVNKTDKPDEYYDMMNLYYVACTRASILLTGADFMEDIYVKHKASELPLNK